MRSSTGGGFEKGEEMQVIKMYVSGAETLGVVRDPYNAKNVAAPTLVKGCDVVLQLRLFQDPEGLEPYPYDDIKNLTNWQFVMDSDFTESTKPKLQSNPGAIVLLQATETVGEGDVTFTEFRIPIFNMNTEELVEWLGDAESKNGLHAELIGYDADGVEKFVLQIKNFTVRNRISAQGEPTEISPDYLTAGQVTALIASGFEVQFSADKASWHDQQTPEDLYYRFRSASSSSAAWSPAIELLRGPAGDADLSDYQEKLVSGENIATINGQDILDGGNLQIAALPEPLNDDGARLVGNTSGAEWVFGEDNTPLSTSSIMFEDGVLYTADIDGATGIDFYYGAEMEMYDQNFGLRVTQGATPGSLELTCNGDSVWWGNDDSPPHYAADNTPPDISTASRAYMIRLHWDAVGHHLLANLAYTEDV